MTGIERTLPDAWLDLPLLPWRPRRRKMKAESVRETAWDFGPPDFDDPAGFALGIAVWVLLLVAAPVMVVLLAWLLFAFELPVLLIIGAVLVVLRVCGLIPWTVVIVDANGERRLPRRNLLRARREIRAITGRVRVDLRWSWF